MKEKKKLLRKQIAALKKLQSDSTLKQLSHKILASLEQLPAFEEASVLLLYYSLSDEVCTHNFIEKWKDKKTILLPVVVGDELELRHYTGTNDLQIGAYGINEPTGALFCDYNAIDLAVIPGVAFDKEGHRLGRGKGYYDRLLPKIHAIKVGICFPFQLLPAIPAEPFDIKMDVVIYD